MATDYFIPEFLDRQPPNGGGAGKPGEEMQPVVRYWTLHLLVQLGGMKTFLRLHDFHDDELAEALGMIDADSVNTGYEYDRKDAERKLRRLYKAMQREKSGLKLPQMLSRNVGNVARLVGLTETDCQLLQFTVLMKLDSGLTQAANYLGEMGSGKVIQTLGSQLDISEKEIRSSLHPNGILARSGLLTLDRCHSHSLPHRLDLLSESFVDMLYSTEAEPLELLRDRVIQAAPSNISLEAYQQVKQHLVILLPYLRNCLKSRKRGVNILLYGPPGVGKTQLTRALAGETGTELFDISSEDLDGDPVEGGRRLGAFRAAQCFLSGRPSLLVFDEAEDIFASGGPLSPRSIADRHKAWMNKMLEENPVPTFWLSNDISNLDPAFLRRFDMVVEVGWPTRSQRLGFLQAQCGDFIDPSTIERIADTDNIAPAVTERAVAVIRSVKDSLPQEGVASALELLVNDTLKSQRHRPIASHNPNRVPELYDPAFINADKDMARVCAGLKNRPVGRLCLYGPPGTGKTAFGKWLAGQLQKPLLVKRASDLISMWVGGTEKNIARAFEEAGREGAILLIDEVDSFLQDRRGASRSWEVTAVNEMLTQMESFNGLFIASTNLMTGLDPASLRRFDLKVEFNYLLPHQAWQLFCRHCEKLGLPVEESLQRRFAQLTNLTPGDFAAVARQNSFSPLETAADLLQALVGESGIKEDAPGKGIGFIRH